MHILETVHTFEAVHMMVEFAHILEVARRIEVAHNKQLEIRAREPVAAEEIELGRQVVREGVCPCLL